MTEISRTQFAIAAVVVVAVVLLGSRALGASSSGEPPIGAATSYATGTQSSPAGPQTTTDASTAAGGVRIDEAAGGVVVVHVAGRVRHPGLYRLKDGQRIADAVKRAGGRAKDADLNAINLAAKLTDGEQVLVPRRAAVVSAGGGGGAAAPAGDTGATPGAIVSLNSATEEQLETIDGVGPATAAKIIEFRQQNGGFRSVDDLAQISGIGPKRLEAMRPHVSV